MFGRPGRGAPSSRGNFHAGCVPPLLWLSATQLLVYPLQRQEGLLWLEPSEEVLYVACYTQDNQWRSETQLDTGIVQLTIQHEPIRGVTGEMIAWAWSNPAMKVKGPGSDKELLCKWLSSHSSPWNTAEGVWVSDCELHLQVGLPIGRPNIVCRYFKPLTLTSDHALVSPWGLAAT